MVEEEVTLDVTQYETFEGSEALADAALGDVEIISAPIESYKDEIYLQNDAICEFTGLNGEAIKIPGFLSPNEASVSLLIPPNLLVTTGQQPSEPILLSIPLNAAEKSGITVTPVITKSNETWECQVCGENTDSELTLKEHLLTHDKKEFRCLDCFESFNVEVNLTVHRVQHDALNLVCPVCAKKFSRYASLKSHVLVHAEDDGILCCECGQEFARYADLEVHRAIHSEQPKEVPYKPDDVVTKKTFRAERNLLKSGKYTCKYCGKGFSKPSLLIRHKRVHTKERPFVCDVCGGGFAQKVSLELHLFTHSGQKPNKCPYCELSFVQKPNLTNHVRKVHEGDGNTKLSINCPYCTCRFGKSSTLNCHITRFHMKNKLKTPSDGDILEKALKNSGLAEKSNTTEESNNARQVEIQDPIVRDDDGPRRYVVNQRYDLQTGIRWYICDRSACSKEFQKPSDLIRHFRAHAHEKPFSCSLCSRQFASKTTLLEHLQGQHLNDAFECNECGKTLYSKKGLRHHEQKHKEKSHTSHEITCHLCNLKFPGVTEWKRHQESEGHLKSTAVKSMEPLIQFKNGELRPVMSRKLKWEANLREADPEERPHQCHVCKFRFRRRYHLRQHLLQHEGIKPFLCLVCNKKFTSSSVLKVHMRSHTGQRDFQCTSCGKSFTTKSMLKRHYDTYHSEVRRFSCPDCKRTFKTANHCRKHIKSQHLDWVDCPMEEDGNRIAEFHNEVAVVAEEIVNPHMLPEELHTHDIVEEVGSEFISTELLAEDALPGLTSESICELESTLDQQLFSTDDAPAVFLVNSPDKDPPSPILAISGENSAPIEEVLDLSKEDLLDVDPDKNRKQRRGKRKLKALSEAETRMVAAKKLPKDAPVSEKILVQAANEQISLLNNKINSDTTLKDACKKFYCKECGSSFRKSHDLIRHMRTHTGEKPFQCPICSKSFALKSTLTSHTKVHDLFKVELECHLCKAGFSSRSSLKVHMRLHTGAKPFICNNCGKAFRTSGHLKHHCNNGRKCWQSNSDLLRTVDENELLEDNREMIHNLQIMQRVDLAEQRAREVKKCRFCDKEFSKLAQLLRHERVHTGEKPYCCLECGRRFAQNYSLQRHFKCHTKERNFACNYCDFKASQKYNLQKHIRKIHEFAYHLIYDKKSLKEQDSAKISQSGDLEQVMGELFPQVS